MMRSIPLMDCGDAVSRAEVGAYKQVVAKTAAYTILASDTGTIFTNIGAGASVTFTLPTPKSGMFFGFFKGVSTQNLVVTAPTAATMLGLTAGVTVTNSTSEYGKIWIISDGTYWYIVGTVGTWAIS